MSSQKHCSNFLLQHFLIILSIELNLFLSHTLHWLNKQYVLMAILHTVSKTEVCKWRSFLWLFFWSNIYYYYYDAAWKDILVKMILLMPVDWFCNCFLCPFRYDWWWHLLQFWVAQWTVDWVNHILFHHDTQQKVSPLVGIFYSALFMWSCNWDLFLKYKFIIVHRVDSMKCDCN